MRRYSGFKVILSIIFYPTTALVAVGAVLYVVGLYNQIVSSAREVDRQFANVEVSLKQRPTSPGPSSDYLFWNR